MKLAGLFRVAAAAATLSSLCLPPTYGQNGGPVSSSSAEAPSRAITAADLLRIRTIPALDLAPDGSRAVFAVRSIHPEAPAAAADSPKPKYRTHLWLLDLADEAAEPRPLTSGDRSDSQPAISPDGRMLAFVRTPAPEGESKDRPKPQVWLMPLDGPGEARQATALEHGASAPRWRPDSGALLVSSNIPWSKIDGAPEFDLERPGREWRDFDHPPVTPPAPGDAGDGDSADKIDARPHGDARAIRNWLEQNAAKDSPAVYNRIDFQDELTIRGEATTTHLYLVTLDGDREPGPDPVLLHGGFRDANDPVFSPDGRFIYFSSTATGTKHPDRIIRTSIWRMNADGSDAREFLADPRMVINDPEISPDGALMAFAALQENDVIFGQRRLGVYDLTTGAWRWATDEWDSHAESARFPGDGSLMFSSPTQGADVLMTADIRTKRARGDAAQVRALTTGDMAIGAFDVAGNTIVAAASTPANPSELMVLKRGADGRAERRTVTALNSEWLKDRDLAGVTEHWLERNDAAPVQYWVMKPANFDASRSYPVVLEMHGGPMAMWGPTEQTMWHEFQLLCARGYGIVYCNPRGSSGYGREFQAGNYQDWGAGPTSDVLGCLDAALAANPWMDRERLFLTGGSYAGYLTAWIVAHDHRFKAAVAQRGVYDLVTFFGEGNAWRLVEWAFGGFPWQPEIRKILERESPFTHVENIRTPLLIIHSSNDLRTGVSQSEMLYRALKHLERPVEYARYPGAGHDLSRTGDPTQRMDRLLRIIEFFDRFDAKR